MRALFVYGTKVIMFFQAEDGIRDDLVTGVQTCALPISPGFWRGVNVNHNAIYLECFMDELAHSVGQDPLEFRRKLMTEHPKHLAVLNAVADRIGWGKPAPQGISRGIAQHMGYGSYVAGGAQ